MTKILELDFETFGVVDLRGEDSVGLHNYMTHPQTEILMAGYRLPGETEVKLWELYKEPMPATMKAALCDDNVLIMAYNSAFERYALKYKLGFDIPVRRFIDPQVYSRSLSLPGKLEIDGEVLNLPESLAKDKRGEELIKLFTMPHQAKKKRGEAVRWVRYDQDSHPKEWQEFGEYCKQDIVAEAELLRRQEMLGVYPQTPFERKLWEFDQTVNDRGLPVDMAFVTKAYELAERSKAEALEAQNKVTGLENANSRDQLLPWVRQRGYPVNTLRADTVKIVLKDPEVKLTQECRDVLEARITASSTAYKKLEAIIRTVSNDGQLRNQFLFLGSPRCGRWAGNAVQLHNLARPMVLGKTAENPDGYDFEKTEVLEEARRLVLEEKYDEIKKKFGSVLLTVKCLIRTSFIAKSDYRLQVCDLNAIETRVGAWLSGCDTLLNVFKPYTDIRGRFHPNGRCPYLDFACKMWNLVYEILDDAREGFGTKATKGDAKRKRQIAKPGVLGAIYRLSGGGWGWSKKSYKDHGLDCDAKAFGKGGKKHCSCPTIRDKIKTGLWGYAENMGVEMTQDQAVEVVRMFRETYKEIVDFWQELEQAVAEVLNNPCTVRRVGPGGCVVIDKLHIDGEYGDLLRMALPSGRRLHYLNARMEDCKMPWQDREGNDVYRPAMVYSGMNQDTKQWESWVQTHGGKLFENLVQAIARDVLAVKLLMFEANELPVIGHVHDEGITMVLNDLFSRGVEFMVQLMSQTVDWAPGLLLGADGFEGQFYHK